MTARRKWPEEAEWARQDAIAGLEQVIGVLFEIVDRDLPQVEMLKRVAKAMNKSRQIQQWLREARSSDGDHSA